MRVINFIIQPPLSLMVGFEIYTERETGIIDGFCVHLLLISIEVSWRDDNDFFNLT